MTCEYFKILYNNYFMSLGFLIAYLHLCLGFLGDLGSPSQPLGPRICLISSLNATQLQGMS